MEPFVYQSLAQRIVFGSGTIAAAGEEVERLGCTRAFLLTTPQQSQSADDLARNLGTHCVGLFTEAAMHTPVEVTERALEASTKARADCLVALGGGSTTGLAKAIALRTDLPQIVIPTTYAGSEATPILGETADGRKTTQRSPKVLPEVVLYDVEMTMTLPPAMSVTSGFNAIAHAIEARYARERNPLISILAVEAVRTLISALPRIVANPQDREARSDGLYGAWAAGTCLGAVGMALHHKICHVLGGSFNLPHAEMHTVILPHATAYNEEVAADLLGPIAGLLGGSPSRGLWDLAGQLGAPRRLADLGMPRKGLAKAADEITSSPYWNPRPVEREPLLRLLEDAFDGRPPRVN
jgi:maleylacetate reductase